MLKLRGTLAARSLARSAMAPYKTVNFEVHGKVQGVYFRAYTKEKADELGLMGWVRNTPKGTVEGVVQGKPEQVDKMKGWLEKEGSPMSQIQKADFTGEEELSSLSFPGFEVSG